MMDTKFFTLTNRKELFWMMPPPASIRQKDRNSEDHSSLHPDMGMYVPRAEGAYAPFKVVETKEEAGWDHLRPQVQFSEGFLVRCFLQYGGGD